MGKFLQIRISAETYEPEDVEKAFPKLCKLAWPNTGQPESGQVGVLNLVDALWDQVRFGDLGDAQKNALKSGAENAAKLKERLEESLSERDPRAADALSYRIEDALAELEKIRD